MAFNTISYLVPLTSIHTADDIVKQLYVQLFVEIKERIGLFSDGWHDANGDDGDERTRWGEERRRVTYNTGQEFWSAKPSGGFNSTRWQRIVDLSCHKVPFEVNNTHVCAWSTIETFPFMTYPQDKILSIINLKYYLYQLNYWVAPKYSLVPK